MIHSVEVVVIGVVVGGLVGLTGLGGGVVLLPLLILGLRVPPLIAVGSGAVFSSITKIGGAAMHWRLRNIDWRLAGLMMLGSIPGALLGVQLLAFLRSRFGMDINPFLSRFIGVLLILIPVLMLVQGYMIGHTQAPLRRFVPPWLRPYQGAMLTGLVGGLLVGMTSIGSGSVIMMLLLLFYTRAPNVLVGTDVLHAVVLTGTAGLGHWFLGTVDLGLVGWLLVGSIPGVLLGSRLTTIVAPARLRQVLLVILFATGIVMLY